MFRHILSAAIVLFAFQSLGAYLVIDHSLDDSFPQVVNEGGVTNTVDSILQDSGSVADESFSSEATYGSAKTSVSTHSDAEDYGVATTSRVGWQDALTITAPGHMDGKITFDFALSGSMSATWGEGASSTASYEVRISYFNTIEEWRVGSAGGGDPLEDFTSEGKGVWFGEPVVFGVDIGAYTISGGDSDSGASASVTGMELILTGISITDMGGSPIAASVTAESGTVYPINAVPEPASASLMLVSAAVFMLYRRILRSSDRNRI